MIFTKVGAWNPPILLVNRVGCQSIGAKQWLTWQKHQLNDTLAWVCMEHNLEVKSLRKPTLVMEPLTEPTYVVESHKGTYPCSEVSKGA
jgi:hypothetical protein